MWIVKLALRRPYTFVITSILIFVLGVVTITRMATDIFPEINIPVVSVIWSYGGVSPEEMEQRIVTSSERSFTTTVNDIEHIESQSLNGVSVIKVFFQPGAKIEAAVAQLTSNTQTILRALPPGITPPLIIRYNASNVPILQLSVSSTSLSEQELYDNGNNFLRTQLATVQGVSVPLPYGGKPRQIMVDIDPQALFAKGLSATDVTTAISAQNLILPGGNAKLGDREYSVRLNSSPQVLDALNNLPIKQINGTVIYIRDVAQIHDGFAVQNNIVRRDGRRSSLLTILKNGSASTLDVVARVKERLPKIQATLPKELDLEILFDQSIFVKASIHGVLTEGLIAACLTATMILLFLGSWRSTLIVAISIPLSILCSIIALRLLGQTLNIMTLGGLSLAVGILVDDATVEIENIHRNLGQGKPLQQAILDGAQQIAVPAFVSTLAICIVFIPIVFLTGVAQSLFMPLGMAVVFAMLASYLLSRTVVPMLAKFLLAKELHLYTEHENLENNGNGYVITKKDIFWRIHEQFNRQFEKFRQNYRNTLAKALNHRGIVFAVFGAFWVSALVLLPFVGQDFFPQVDAGQFRLHVRAPAGTRLEKTEQIFTQVENEIRQVIPEEELEIILDNIGLPVGGVNLAFSDTATIGPGDGEILVGLKEGKHHSTWQYVRQLRQKLTAQFPELTFFFQPADIVTQILNFGLPAPIDIQVIGPAKNRRDNYKIAKQIKNQIAQIPGAVDVHLHQVVDAPDLRINVDRSQAQRSGLTQRDVANNLLTSLSSSGQTSPNFWLDPIKGVSYLIAVQVPQYKLNSLEKIQNTPVANGSSSSQLLSNLAVVKRGKAPAVVNHYNVQPVFNIYANVQGRDLGGVASDIYKIVGQFQQKLPRGTSIMVKGQVETMNSSFLGLEVGLIFAIGLVYCLIVVNFQSWIDPFIIMMALPNALAGIVWILFVTNTTFSVPSLMGAIMSIGVATANSILLVTFANEQRLIGEKAVSAALAAGYTRLRPVLMTAGAMIMGMLPMSLGLGEGGEQNAPLGRAVIGGLLAATVATLIFVPVIYSILRRKQPQNLELEEELSSTIKLTVANR
ncbi:MULTISPECIES: efflux RND transporter permease subunit [unclassified Nostoc]|uniref:efflux RND transporter permease subunit n=1 Tax=unclassified Nostoc TaxID=2593658 RepID=UPI002AD2C64C|nr:efflux RND transporter permease subunit [Nostoc sp. DedQUE03]MDZ7972283.1 efflux RND transporter permease subunit [Nostoc sp. DedQUE03]MDZ8047906.1 efflux RND transporter permease subunit [Nostoc sp. DedQUE02]